MIVRSKIACLSGGPAAARFSDPSLVSSGFFCGRPHAFFIQLKRPCYPRLSRIQRAQIKLKRSSVFSLPLNKLNSHIFYRPQQLEKISGYSRQTDDNFCAHSTPVLSGDDVVIISSAPFQDMSQCRNRFSCSLLIKKTTTNDTDIRDSVGSNSS